jgi:hypothetical protein
VYSNKLDFSAIKGSDIDMIILPPLRDRKAAI